MAYLESITEELQFKTNWSHGSQNHILLRRLYEYIAQFRAYAMFQFRDDRPGIPENIKERKIAYPIHHISSVRLEINGEAEEASSNERIDGIVAFAAGLEHAEQVKWNAKYSYFHDDYESEINEHYQPAYVYFDEMSPYGSSISELIGLKTIIQIRDEDHGGERFSYYYSPLGKNDLFYGTQTSGDINDVSAIPAWHGDFESMGIVLPITTVPEKRQLIKKVFRELCDRYGATELSDNVAEYSNQIIYGDYWSEAHLTSEQLPVFVRDLKALNGLVIESDPNARLMLDGYLLPDGSNDPACVIQVYYNEERQIQLDIIHLPK